jgi:hypothetical protein
MRDDASKLAATTARSPPARTPRKVEEGVDAAPQLTMREGIAQAKEGAIAA